MRQKYRWLAGVLVVAAVALGLIVTCTRRTENRAPLATFAMAPDGGKAPLDVHLDGTASTDPDGTITAFAWDFGDGQTATGPQTAHRYDTAGTFTFTITLTVTDDRGATDSASKTISVGEAHLLAGHPPLQGEIEPADGATVRGAETWVRWSAHRASGRVR